MTLRELIQEIIKNDDFTKLAECIKKIHPEWSETRDVYKTYSRVAKEIEDLPGDDELKGHIIAMDVIENTLFDKTEKWVDVHLLDPDGDLSLIHI